MAFNPFHGFRKHKKKAFAILTILCMFIFVLSSGLGGRGDLLNSLGMGSGRSHSAPEVATLDGKKIDAQQLQMVRQQRQIANNFMRQLVLTAGDQLTAAIQAGIKDMDPFAKPKVEEILRFRQQMMVHAMSSPQLLQFIINSAQRQVGELDNLIKTMEMLKKDKEIDQLRRLRQMLMNDIRLLGRDMYFFGGYHRGEDLLDFLVWKWTADKLDINLTMDAVMDLIHQDTYGVNIDEAREKLAKDAIAHWKIGESTFRQALIDEYRVRIAQTVVLGAAPGLEDAAPSYVTPNEFYKFFRDNRTSVKANLLPFDAESFLNKVTEKPSESELRDLFAKHAREEPDPSLERPGFKEGKKAKIEWLGTKADNPILKKAALDQAQKDAEFAEKVKKLLFAPPAPNLGGVLGWIGLLGVVENPKLIEKRVDREYDTYVRNERMKNWVYSGLFFFEVHDRNLFQPQAIATGVASMLGGAATGKSALSLPVSWGSRAVLEELKDRVRLGLMPLSLSGPHPTALLAANDGLLPQPMPRAAMGPMLREEVTAQVVRDYLDTEVAKFEEELTKKAKDIKKPEVKKEVETYVADFAKRMGFTRGASAELRDRFKMMDDPGLKPLKDAYLKEDRNKSDPKGLYFAYSFFDDPSGRFPAPQPYHATWFQGKDPPRESHVKPAEDEFFLTWKSDEEAPRVRKFEEARADVEQAWKLAKARELARKAAEDVQKELREKAIRNVAQLKDYTAQKKVTPIEVGPLEKLMMQPAQQVMDSMQYMRPRVPADKVAFPTFDFAEKIVDLRDKPIGETIVLNDAPKNIYYVGVLTERSEPSEYAFQMSYSRANGEGAFGGGDPLLKIFENERRQKFILDTIEQLKSEAKLVPVPEEVKRFGGRDSGGGEPVDDGF
jgi:hypothetical protein